MRYGKDHAAKVRQRLLDKGAQQLKVRGLQGAAVDGIASAAGLSGPALYSHFASKRDLLQAIVGDELAATAARFLDPEVPVAQLLGRYLSLPHARDPARGCALPALTADLARADDELRQTYLQGVEAVAEMLAGRLGDRDRALGTLAAAVGAVALARALPDDAFATEILEATRRLLAEPAA